MMCFQGTLTKNMPFLCQGVTEMFEIFDPVLAYRNLRFIETAVQQARNDSGCTALMYIEILILRSPYKLLMVTLHNLPDGHLLDIVLLRILVMYQFLYPTVARLQQLVPFAFQKQSFF